MKKKVPLIALFYCVLASFSLFSQRLSPKFLNQSDVFGTRVFVENKGQFDHLLGGTKVLYALENGQERIYFTTEGLIYKLEKFYPLTEEDLEAMEKGRHFNGQKKKEYTVKMSWLNASAGVRVEEGDRPGYYFTYGPKEFNSNCFKKITYRNVYENIDIEYTIPADKAYGIKYTVILHPGARAEDIKLAYSGDVERVKEKNGDVIVKTPLEDIVEHAPVSFYEGGQQVASELVVKNQVIGFRFPQGYDQGKTLVIDPWVTAIVSLSTNNYAYDVDYDFNGNTFVYGGYNPFKVANYNSLGVLQWVFAGNIPSTTPAWSSAPIVSQASNFGVSRFNSKTYIGQGFVSNGNRVVRLDASGNYDNFINAPTSQFQEVWDMGFHCVTNEVFVLGGGTSANNSAVTINPTTAVLSLISTFQPTLNSIAQDVVNNAIDDQGVIYIIYAGLNLNDKMCQVNSTFNGNVWTAPSGFTVFTEQGNKNQYQGAGSLSSNGFNCIAVNANYLFYYDGNHLAAYNKTTGAQTASTTVPLTIKREGGIAVDDCNNLYLGGNGSILSYNFNGTSFSTLTSIPLGVNTTNQYVYDIKLDKQTKVLYVCGSGFVANYGAINSLSCPTATTICFNSQPSSQAVCAGSTVNIIVGNPTNLTNATFSIQPTGASNTTGSFVVTPSVTTTYTTFVTGTNAGNVVVTQTSVANVTVFPVPAVAPTLTQSSCTSTLNAFNLNLTFTPTPSQPPNYTISWSPIPNGIFSPTQTAASGGIAPGVYNATVLAGNGCLAITSITINPAPEPSNFNISGGNVVNCYNPTLTVNYTPATYNYTTTNGVAASQTGASAVFTSTNAFGIYTVTAVNPTSGCVSTKTMVITQNTVAPTSALSPTFQNITCSVSSIQMVTATANPTVNVQHVWLSPQGGSLTATSSTASFLPGGPGTYTHMVVNITNGCSVARNFTVASNSGFPTYSVVSPQNFTLGCTTKSVASISIINGSTTPIPGGPISYTILGPPTSTATPPGTLSPQSSYTVNVPGTWTVITKDNTNLCETRTQISVISNTAGPRLDTLIVPQRILNCDTTHVKLEAFTSTPNSSYTWMFPGTPNTLPTNTIMVNTNTASPNTTTIATYTLVITDNNNTCVTTTVVTMSQNIFPPKAGASLGSAAITCITSSISLTNISSTGIPPNSIFPTSKPVIGFTWLGPTPQTPLQVSSTYVGYLPGTYTLIAKDLNNGCISFTTATILDNRDYPDVDRPSPKDDKVLDCGADTVNITANFTPDPSFSYTWTPPGPGAYGNLHNAVLTTSVPGTYFISITNTKNGCQSSGVVNVVDGSLKGSFVAQPEESYAPSTVSFTNTSTSTNNNNKITTIWNFGNGTTQTSKSANDIVSTLYTQPGTYTVTAYVIKGNCVDTVVRIIKVDLPSLLEIPNVFSPNGDGANDVFFLKTANLDRIDIKIFDRWGHKVYDLVTEKGNIAWDGTNQQGKDVAEGVFMYILKANGKDGQTFERKGNITLVR